jgi:hypothetical protein
VKHIAQGVAEIVHGSANFAAGFVTPTPPIVTAATHVLPRIAQAAPNFLASALHFPAHFIPNPS